ncbi:MAG: hypothetical protein ABIK37_03650 [candidate division WOR-3 bacterium]
MPYKFRKNPRGGVDIYKAGHKVAHATSERNAHIFAWKASSKDRKRKKK